MANNNNKLISNIYSNIIFFFVNAIAYGTTLADALKNNETKAFIIAAILTTIPTMVNAINVFMTETNVNAIKKIIYIITIAVSVIYIIAAIILLYVNALSIIFCVSIVIGMLPIGEAAFNAVDAWTEYKNTT